MHAVRRRPGRRCTRYAADPAAAARSTPYAVGAEITASSCEAGEPSLHTVNSAREVTLRLHHLMKLGLLSSAQVDDGGDGAAALGTLVGGGDRDEDSRVAGDRGRDATDARLDLAVPVHVG